MAVNLRKRLNFLIAITLTIIAGLFVILLLLAPMAGQFEEEGIHKLLTMSSNAQSPTLNSSLYPLHNTSIITQAF